MTWDAALMAGGRSRRFGSDKAFADWNGTPLYLFQLGKLGRLDPDRLWLSAREDQAFPEFIDGVERVDDTRPDLGPVGGMLGVFERSGADFVLVLAVDLPLIEGVDLLAWLRLAEKDGKGRAARIGGRWEPLAAVYPREAFLALLRDAAEGDDLSLQHLLDRAREKELLATVETVAPESFANLNTTEEYLEARKLRENDRTVLRRFRREEGFGENEPDFLAVEDPLEIRVNGKSVAVMMRTPGDDEDLALGFLFTEGVIRSADEVLGIESAENLRGNLLSVELEKAPDFDQLTRHVFTSSSCGVCGKATIDSVFQAFPPLSGAPGFDPETILSLPGKLRARQDTFEKTGGLHASAVFSREGELHFLREDVGRHNALDKVIGCALKSGFDLSDAILLVSGRISFELMQKALSARIPIVAGISAPSSLAVDLARESGQTLIGFLRGTGFNLYAGKA